MASNENDNVYANSYQAEENVNRNSPSSDENIYGNSSQIRRGHIDSVYSNEHPTNEANEHPTTVDSDGNEGVVSRGNTPHVYANDRASQKSTTYEPLDPSRVSLGLNVYNSFHEGRPATAATPGDNNKQVESKKEETKKCFFHVPYRLNISLIVLLILGLTSLVLAIYFGLANEKKTEDNDSEIKQVGMS